MNVQTHFGARGDGRTDDTRALQRALNQLTEHGGTLEIPPGCYLTGPLTVRRQDRQPTISLRGAGSAVPLQTAGHAATELKYIGPGGGILLHLYGMNGGTIEGVNLDANHQAASGLLVEGSVGTKYDALTVTNSLGFGFALKGSDAGVYRNVFERLGTDQCAGGLLLTGTSLNVNVAQNSFTRTDLGWSGPMDGLRLESADNNDFLGTSIVGQNAGNALLLTFCSPTATALGAVANRFHGLDGSPYRIVAEATAPNAIFGLSFRNGLPPIVGTQIARLCVVGPQ